MSSRRDFLKGAVAGTAAAGAAAFGAGALLVSSEHSPKPTEKVATASFESLGANQPGIDAAPLKYVRLISLEIKPEISKSDMSSWMSLLADDIDRLMAHKPLLAETQPELSEISSPLAINIGYGPSLFRKLKLNDQLPLGFDDIPSFPIDDLDPASSGGDVLIYITSDDSLQMAHTSRSLIRDSDYFASIKWIQDGFSSVQATSPLGSQRNLMGQIDGTGSPQPGTVVSRDSIWSTEGPNWYAGGTTLVYRKIAMNLTSWDQLDYSAKEDIIGRRLSTGAPLNGKSETDPLDLNARGSNGLLAIPGFSHVRQAEQGVGSRSLFRKPFNYSDGLSQEGSDEGLLWMAFCRNMAEQYLPVQQKLAKFDLLNKWTTPKASAVFAMPKGRQTKQDKLCGGLFS